MNCGRDKMYPRSTYLQILTEIEIMPSASNTQNSFSIYFKFLWSTYSEPELVTVSSLAESDPICHFCVFSFHGSSHGLTLCFCTLEGNTVSLGPGCDNTAFIEKTVLTARDTSFTPCKNLIWQFLDLLCRSSLAGVGFMSKSSGYLCYSSCFSFCARLMFLTLAGIQHWKLLLLRTSCQKMTY